MMKYTIILLLLCLSCKGQDFKGPLGTKVNKKGLNIDKAQYDAIESDVYEKASKAANDLNLTCNIDFSKIHVYWVDERPTVGRTIVSGYTKLKAQHNIFDAIFGPHIDMYVYWDKESALNKTAFSHELYHVVLDQCGITEDASHNKMKCLVSKAPYLEEGMQVPPNPDSCDV